MKFDWRRKATVGIALFFICAISYIFGFYNGTGTLPFFKMSSVLPPTMQTNVTSQEVQDFVYTDPLDLQPYGDKNNCVELAFLAARQLWWDGYPATVMRIDFSDGTSHMLVGIPTTDEGWKFLEPQSSSWVNPIIGGSYWGKSITSVYFLYDFIWQPIGG